MYSVILAAALATGPETPSYHGPYWGVYPYAPVAYTWAPVYPSPYYWPYWSWYYPYWAYYGWPYPYAAYFAYAPAYAYAPSVAVSPAGGTVGHSVVTIKVPAGGQLLVDGRLAPPPASDVNGVKTYRTPGLPAGRMFTYTFSVETVIDGKPARADKTVYFRAGEPVSVDFTSGVKVVRAAE